MSDFVVAKSDVAAAKSDGISAFSDFAAIPSDFIAIQSGAPAMRRRRVSNDWKVAGAQHRSRGQR